MLKEIRGYEGLYAVDDQGNVWSLQQTASRRKGKLKPFVNAGGYLRVNLHKDGKTTHYYVHRLVAEAFIANPEGQRIVNHIDTNPQNNKASNLEWCDQSYNIQFSRSLGNQNDIPIAATSLLTGKRKEYKNLRDAGIDLFGKWWALRYPHRKKGNRFFIGEWLFEVMPK